MTYDLIVTAVSERADLFARSMNSLLAQVDVQPQRILVHEDVKPGSKTGSIQQWLWANHKQTHLFVRNPAAGLGPAIHSLLSLVALSPVVLYAQDDWDFVRPLPIATALGIMGRHNINHITFHKHEIPKVKHSGQPDEWRKEVCLFDGQPLTIAQYWRSTPSLWRQSFIKPYFDKLMAEDKEPDMWAMVKVNHWMNEDYLGDHNGNDHAGRAAILKTFLWGGHGEEPFVVHTGGDRRAEKQSIQRYGAPRTCQTTPSA